MKDMNRQYTREGYLSLVQKIRDSMPGGTLTTDVMVGYPGETEADFEETISVMQEAKFDMAFTALYSPRAGTKSAKAPDDVPMAEKKRRDKILIATVAETAKENNQVLVGQTIRVLIDGKKRDKYYGRSAGYKVVEIETERDLSIGQFCDVLIESAGSWKLIGSLTS
jgi:tRNA-2-methylthio-N6-dimethylallyladenosine synthase